MTTRISVPLSEVDEDFLRRLKEQYPDHTRLDIQLVDLDSVPSFNETVFWEIIDQLDLDANAYEATLTPAIQALAQRPVSDIYLFEDMLSEKLHQLDTKLHAQAAYPNGRVSVDGFLYVRAAVVAGGKTRFQAVIANPELMPQEESFEALLSLAARAFEQKTGETFDYLPPVDYETYANESGWK